MVQFPNSNNVFQTGSLGSVSEDAAATGGSGFPAPMHHEANVFGNTLTSLTSGLYTLNDNTNAGPGDVTWAFEWDLPIAANGNTIFSKSIVVNVPEPGTIGLVAAGFAGLGLMGRRRQS